MENQEQVEVTSAKAVMGALRGKYGKDGSCGDAVAAALKDADLNSLIEFAGVEAGVDTSKYDHLNNGQKRMNIGNKLRTAVKKGEISVEQLAAIPRQEPKPAKAKAQKAEAPAE